MGLAMAWLVILLSMFPALAPGVQAQGLEGERRPTVGLVLSGGGARGGAHVGVLKVLEKYRVPVDVVTGTSIGAFVGALYATGRSPDEIEELLLRENWGEIFSTTTPRGKQSFRRKQEEEALLVRYRLDVSSGRIILPRGIVPGYRLNLLLQGLFTPSVRRQSFDNLAIPFRAVATDFEQGSEVVLGSGDLAAAVYTSMAVPGLLSPVQYRGRILVDGGLVNNIPVSVARSMGADVVIVSDVGSPFRGREQLTSVFSVLDQTIKLLVTGNAVATLRSLHPQDTLIQPDLGDIETADFEDIALAIPRGVEATEAVAEQLRALSLPDSGYEGYRVARGFAVETDPIVDFIRIENDSNISDDVIRAKIGVRPGNRLDPDGLRDDLARVFALDTFERVGYRLVEEEGRTGLVVEADSKASGGDFIRLGLAISENFDDNSDYNIGVSYNRLGMNGLGAEWRTVLEVGSRPLLFTEWYQPLDFNQRYFISPFTLFSREDYKVNLENDRTTSEVRVTTAAVGTRLGRNFGNRSQLGVGYEFAHLRTETTLGSPNFEDSSQDGVFSIFYSLDTLDSLNFPSNGSRMAIDWEAHRRRLGGSSNFNLASFSGVKNLSRDRDTFTVGLDMAAAYNGDADVENLVTLGGFWNLSGLQPGDLSGQYKGFGRLVYYRQLAGDPIPNLVNVPVYLGGSLETGNTWDTTEDISFDSTVWASSVFLGLDTVFGPVYFAGGWAEGGERSLYLFVGSP